MFHLVDRLTPQYALELCTAYFHLELPEQHGPHRHFIDDGIEPLDQQKLNVRGLARHFYTSLDGDLRIADDVGERKRRLLEGHLDTRPPTAQTDIGIVRKLLPPSVDECFCVGFHGWPE